MREKKFNSSMKTVGGGEGDKCHYPTRLDAYGCGCFHDCKYCYAKSLLSFRNLWNNNMPSVANIKDIAKDIRHIKTGSVVRLGGMTDCFQPMELYYRNTYNTIKMLNRRGIHYLIVTKSHIVANDEYIKLFDKNLAHIQVSVTSTNDELSKTFERASVPSKRIAAIEKLYDNGFDVSIRLSPYIPQYIDVDVINNIRCDKLLVEFLRVNSWIKKWFDIDYSEWTLNEGGYQHLPLEKKLELINKLHKKEMTVCEDVLEHYKYWQDNFNFNNNDCCNLRL